MNGKRDMQTLLNGCNQQTLLKNYFDLQTSIRRIVGAVVVVVVAIVVTVIASI